MAIDPQSMEQLVLAFLAADPAGKRRLLEQKGAILLRPEVEALLRTAAAWATSDGNAKAAEFSSTQADLLRASRENGVAATSAKLGRDVINQAWRSAMC